MKTNELRKAALKQESMVGLKVEHLAEWRLLCPPGRVLELLDELDRARELARKRTDEVADLIVENASLKFQLSALGKEPS